MVWRRPETRRRGGLPPLPGEDEDREIYRITASVLAEYGYHRYEISNYAKDGYECRHNLGYWERKEYLGLGLGASSLIRECRFHNTADMEKYMLVYGDAGQEKGTEKNKTCVRRPETDGQGSVTEEMERLSAEEQMEEFMFLGLGKWPGYPVDDFQTAFGRDIRDVYGEKLTKLEKEGLIRSSRRKSPADREGN